MRLKPFATVLAFVFCGSAWAADGLKPIDQMLKFSCPAGQSCKVKCWGAGGDLDQSYTNVLIYQFKDHPTRMWLYVDDKYSFVLGVDQTCKFDGTLLVGGVPPIDLKPTPSPTPAH